MADSPNIEKSGTVTQFVTRNQQEEKKLPRYLACVYPTSLDDDGVLGCVSYLV